MSINKTPILLFFIAFSLLINTQESSKDCNCTKIENNEENDVKVVALAESIENSFHNESTDAFNDMFNIDCFTNRITDNELVESDSEFAKGFLQGVKGAVSTLSARILGEMQNGAYYNLISYEYNIIEEAYYFTFRLYSEETGVNYHDYKVCRVDGELMFNDIYIYVTGEHLSETLQRFLIKSEPPKNPVKKLFGNDKKVDVDHFLLARAMVDKGEFQNAYNEIDKISGTLAKEKFILLYKSGIAAEISNELYEKNLAEFADLFPEDPTLYLKLIDYNILKENYRKANENIDKLIFETEDNFLRIMKAKVCLLDGDYETAENHYNYMMEYYPDFFESYIGAMITLNYLNRFDEALNIADNLVEMGYDKDMLAEFFEEKDEFGENVLDPLVKSKSYKKWKRKS